MRIAILRGFLVILFIILFTDLFLMQLIKGREYAKQSENNRIRLVPEDASRGIIYDRNNIALVENKLAFDIVAVPYEIESKNKKTLFARLSKFLNINPEVLADTFSCNYNQSFSPVMLASDVNREIAFSIEQNITQLAGIFVKTRAVREYIYGPVCAHIIGYIGKMQEDEYPELRKYGYQIKDFIGRNGLEKSFDAYLRGKPGGMQLEVNSEGSIIQVLSYRPPAKGEDLYLTIDVELQTLIYNLLSGTNSAVTVMNADTGEILALLSSPSFDPNILIDKKKYNQIGEILKDQNSPLLNRNLNAYPPGSIFKIVTAYAGLSKGKIDLTSEFFCPGFLNLGNTTRHCWLKKGHGQVNITHALATSCNVFFWELGLKIGEKNLADSAQIFGFSKQTKVELPSENTGLLPQARWKMQTKHEKWYAGDTLNFSIGQGFLLVTPLQTAKMVAMIANGGKEIKPHLIKTTNKVNKSKQILSPSAVTIIKKGMFEVVNSSFGTGRKAALSNIKVYAKTGTAQTGQGETHAWFVGFAQAGNKNICFVIFLEHGGHGGERPAEIAKEIILYFKKD
ncbi:MAG: penicillin-binding protein 2 [Candidatus Omnitrophota bacterium]